MIKVVLLGAGNVAYHLAKTFDKAVNIDFVQQYSRNKLNERVFDSQVPTTNSLNNLCKADIYVIAISDDAISALSEQLHFDQGLVVHTSGSMPLQSLQCTANKGVFYPLQTFSKSQAINFKNIPVAIETEHREDLDLLMQLAKAISDKVYEINSLQREKLHIAAVFANNFSNQMFTIAKDICDEHGFSFDILKPLIKETAEKVQTLPPKQAQTGPAKRNDQKVIEKHRAQLSGEQEKIYTMISQSIQKTFKH